MLFIIIAFVFIVYARTIRFGAVVDDDRLLLSYKASARPRITWKNFMTQIPQRLYGAGTFGQDLAIEHLVTIGMHAATCALIFVAFGRNEVAFTAAMLYACNPANNQTAIWMNGRRYQCVVILFLLAIIAGPWGIPLYLASFAFQMTGAMTPIAMGPWGALVVAAVLGLNRAKLAQFCKSRLDGIVNEDQRKFMPKRLIVVVKTFAFMVIKMIAPGRTLMIYPFLVQWGITPEGNRKAYALDFHFWAGCAMLAGSAAALFLLNGRDVWLLAFLLAATLQCCNFMAANQNVADRYVSLPNVVMMYFLSKAILLLAPHRLDGMAMGAIMAYYLTNLNVTMAMYKDLEAYYDYHLFYAPESPIPRRDIIYGHINAGRVVMAWPLILKGLQHNPKDFTMLCLAARALQLMGDFKNSDLYIAMAEQNHYYNQKEYHQKDLDMMREVNRRTPNA